MTDLDPEPFTLRQAAQSRDDFAQVMDELDFVKELIARLPTRRDQAFQPLKIMFGSAVLSSSIVIGWHFLADRAGPATSVAAATRPAHQAAPSSSLSCPPGPREAPGPDVPRLPALARPNNQPNATQAGGELKVTHALHTRHARQEPPSSRADGDERNHL